MAGTTKQPTGSTTALTFEHIERRQSDTYLLDTRVLEMLEKYPAYIKSVSGHAPTAAEVVEKALDKVLSADLGFKKFLALSNGKGPAKPVKNGSSGESHSDRSEAGRNGNPKAADA